MAANINYSGLCALIAVTAVAAVVVIAVAGIVWQGRALTEHGANALNIAIGGLLTLAGTYIGGRLGSKPSGPSA
jgi:hypothetical protein